MKNKITLGVFTLVLAAIISSCSTSSDVASNRKIQKRKYNKGFFVGNNNITLNKKKQESKTVYTEQSEVVENENSVKVESIVNSTTNSFVNETTVNTPSNNDANTSVKSNVNNNVSSNETDFSELITENKNIKNNNKTNNLKKRVRISKKEKKSPSGDEMLILLVILAFLIPFIAVGIKTDWDLMKVLICLILTILFWLPGVIYALLIVFDVI